MCCKLGSFPEPPSTAGVLQTATLYQHSAKLYAKNFATTLAKFVQNYGFCYVLGTEV
jgi:hypothetical protein